MAFFIPLATLTAAASCYAVYTELRHRQTRHRLAVLDDELTATNRAVADRTDDTAKIVQALKSLDTRTLVHHQWLNGLATRIRMDMNPIPHTPIDPNDVVEAAERIVRGESA